MAEYPSLSVALTLAPAAISSSIIALCSPRPAYIWEVPSPNEKAPRQAIISAVAPQLFTASILTLVLISSSRTSSFWFMLAHISAVKPLSSLALTSAPASFSFPTTSLCPRMLAKISAAFFSAWLLPKIDMHVLITSEFPPSRAVCVILTHDSPPHVFSSVWFLSKIDMQALITSESPPCKAVCIICIDDSLSIISSLFKSAKVGFSNPNDEISTAFLATNSLSSFAILLAWSLSR